MATDIPVIKNITYSNGNTSTITYTWKITGLRTKKEGDYNDAVVQTFWTVTGTDTFGNESAFIGATPLTTVNIPPDYQFIPFSNLDETTVLGWVKDQVVGEYANHIMGQIFQRLDGQANTVVDQPLPWGSQDPA
jgi:hypothetical protein